MGLKLSASSLVMFAAVVRSIAERSFCRERTTLSTQQRKTSLKLGTSDEFGTVLLLLSNKRV